MARPAVHPRSPPVSRTKGCRCSRACMHGNLQPCRLSLQVWGLANGTAETIKLSLEVAPLSDLDSNIVSKESAIEGPGVESAMPRFSSGLRVHATAPPEGFCGRPQLRVQIPARFCSVDIRRPEGMYTCGEACRHGELILCVLSIIFLKCTPCA